jgi:hypothetical protein
MNKWKTVDLQTAFISRGKKSKRKESGKEMVSQFYPEDGDKFFSCKDWYWYLSKYVISEDCGLNAFHCENFRSC